MRNCDLTSADVAKLGRSTELMEREWAPCRNACPVHADVRSYLQALAEGRWTDAIDVIRENLPFASVCGRVCHHPCEANCRRRDVDAAVAIRELKRFVAEKQGASGSTVHKAAKQDKPRVAIVGAGPAGLSAALNLAMMGYRPTVFEKFPVAGGIPRTAIPAYRMPREVVQIDVDWICAHGVDLVTGVEIGKTKSLDDLKREGFEAVIVATGLSSSRMLPMPSADNPRVFGALAFLTDAAFGRKVDLGEDVLVIGGGNVAVDTARTALRLCLASAGGKKPGEACLAPTRARVRMMCLESAEEMPAYEWERRETAEEGIDVINRRGPVEVIVKHGKITGLKTRAVTRVFDENKRFSPQYNDADVSTLECDTVIMAIGQSADMNFLAGGSLKLDERKRLPVNAATHQANVPWVFAAGEIVTPPGSAVEACASGRRCAKAVDLFLRGEAISIDDSLPPYIDKIPAETAAKVLKVEREAVACEPAEARKTSFIQIDHTYAMDAVLREARRCMSCGAGAEVLVDKCAACLTCLRVCPFGIPKVTDVARIESDKCQSCGICIAECPANAIVAKGWDARAPIPVSSETVVLISGFRATAEEWNHVVPPIPGVSEVYLATVARLSVRDLLDAVERGAKKVLVVACRDGQDRYPEATKRAKKRVEQASALLAEIGIKGAVKFLDVADAGRDAVRAAIEASL